jgi:hypothetical protein
MRSEGAWMSVDTDILIFVEDPGAANCVMGLPDTLLTLGVHASIYARGSSIEYMKSKGACIIETPEDFGATDLLEKTSPKLILIGTSENQNTLGLQLMAPAKERNIPTIGIIDGPANAQLRFKGYGSSPLQFAPDMLILPTERLKDAFADMGYDKEHIFVGGHPHYDEVKAARFNLHAEGRLEVRKRVLPDAPDNVPVVIFAAEISDGLDPSQFRRSNDYTLQGHGQSELRTNVVLDELIDCLNTQSPRPYLVLRLHPNNTLEEFSSYLSGFDRISSTESAIDICYCADLVMGMTSILLMEAAILGRPTLSLIPREIEKDWLESISLGITPVATSRNALHRHMNQFMESWPKKPDNHVDEVIRFGSTERIAHFLKNIIKSKSQ